MERCDCMSLGDRLIKSIMGNAVRIQNEIAKAVKQDSCTACGVYFNLIHHRRRTCSNCKDSFCSSCLIRIPGSSSGASFLNDSDTRICNRCRVFSSSNYSWDELMQLKVRDLIWFLERRHVCTEGLKEKEQLVEVIMNCYGSDGYHEDQARRQQRVALMTCNMQSEFPASSNAQPSDDDTAADAPTTDDHPVTEPPHGVSPPPYLSPPTPPPAPAPTEDEPSAPRFPNERVLLTELTACEDVDELSVRQLKVLLAANHVNYRGCCEKSELIARAKQLVKSHLANIKRMAAAEEAVASGTPEKCSAAGDDPLDPLEEDMCKICMDALIDCVFLECGHMVTCLDCGKRMAECPICRQYVVRAVRIFKA